MTKVQRIHICFANEVEAFREQYHIKKVTKGEGDTRFIYYTYKKHKVSS